MSVIVGFFVAMGILLVILAFVVFVAICVAGAREDRKAGR